MYAEWWSRHLLHVTILQAVEKASVPEIRRLFITGQGVILPHVTGMRIVSVAYRLIDCVVVVLCT